MGTDKKKGKDIIVRGLTGKTHKELRKLVIDEGTTISVFVGELIKARLKLEKGGVE